MPSSGCPQLERSAVFHNAGANLLGQFLAVGCALGQRRIVRVCQEPAFDKHRAVYRFAQDIKPSVFYPAVRAVCCRHHMPLDRTRQGSFSGRCKMRAYPASGRSRGSVEMDADEYRFGMRIGDRGTCTERNKRVIPPGQNGFEACSLERVVQAQGDIESDALFRNEILRDSAKIVAAVSGVDYHGGKYRGADRLVYHWRHGLFGFGLAARMLRFCLRGKNRKHQNKKNGNCRFHRVFVATMRTPWKASMRNRAAPRLFRCP